MGKGGARTQGDGPKGPLADQLRAIHSVGEVRWINPERRQPRNGPQIADAGTCAIIWLDKQLWLLTNQHVLPNADAAQLANVRIVVGTSGLSRDISLRPDLGAFFSPSSGSGGEDSGTPDARHLDFALIRLNAGAPSLVCV
jgi:hypothetical protein